ncbi:hypothetical protein C2857_007572 [Epichloe festucae Fl1]|uniref:F-box domain-containing protein n=1 Tax=Epichloe festucae (strain Fl1) TaxID=877507 RepID=A0A7S9KQV3_EPIFF|nr:hypothetical protein C2857_007572 [Epichloe festucae Fl1]
MSAPSSFPPTPGDATEQSNEEELNQSNEEGLDQSNEGELDQLNEEALAKLTMGLTPEVRDAILNTVAYPRPELALAAISPDPRRDDLVERCLVEPFPASVVVRSSMGILEALPMCNASAVLLQLDIQSYWNLRQVSRRARHVASDIHRYRVVAQAATDAMRAMLRCGIAKHVRVIDLYDALASSRCRFCDDNIGDFLFMPQVSRCCFACLQSSPRLDMVNLDEVEFGRDQKTSSLKLFCRLFPVMHTLPGRYSMEQTINVTRSHIAPKSLAMEPLAAQLGMRLGDIDRIGEPLGRYAASIRFPFFDMVTSYVQYGVYCKGCYVASRNPGNRAYAARAARDRDRSTRLYTERDFMRHFSTCSNAIRLWRYSERGRRIVGQSTLDLLPYVIGNG